MFFIEADEASATRVNGASQRDWVAGWNVYQDGTVINHSRVHPIYAAAIVMSVLATALHGLGGSRAPRSAVHGLKLVYESLLHHRFPAPPYRPPGGTVYRAGTSALYMPAGNDWGTKPLASFLSLDAAAHALHIDPQAAAFELRHATTIARMQARSSDGRTYQSLSEFASPWNQENDAVLIGEAWLMEWAAANHHMAATDADYFRPGSLPPDALTGREWSRYPPAPDHSGTPESPDPHRVPAALALPRHALSPRVELPRVTVVEDRHGFSIEQSAAGRGAAAPSVDIVLPGYLIHLPEAARPGRASVIRRRDGRRTCYAAAHAAGPGPRRLLARVSLRCIGGALPRHLVVVTVAASSGSRGSPVLIARRT